MRSACISRPSPRDVRAAHHARQGAGLGRALFRGVRGGGPGVRTRTGLELHPGRPRRHERSDPRDLRASDRARRLSVRRAVRADLGHAAGKPSGAVAGLHARDPRAAGARCCAQAGLQATDIKAGCGKCGACSALSTYEREAARMIFEPFQAVSGQRISASNSRPTRGSGAEPPRCGARSSARSRASSKATIATRSTRSAIPIVAISLVRRRCRRGCRHGSHP